MTEQPQLVIIGSGAAGMAAAAIAVKRNIKTVVLDDQPAIGGQIYRGITSNTVEQRSLLGASYAKGLNLTPDTKQHNSVKWVQQASVWQLDKDGTVYYSDPNRSASLKPDFVILATGAMERPMPFPGWTLPGVMTAGAVQIALKSSQLIPEGKLVLAGSGPLLYLLAIQLVDAGADLTAMVDTTPRQNMTRSLSLLPGMLRSGGLLSQGMKLLNDIRTRKIKRYRHATQLQALGTTGITGLQFVAGSRTHRLDCNVLAIHNGVVPNVQLSRQLGLGHDWQATARCWVPRLHDVCATQFEWLKIAGDGGGVLGAEAAQLQGEYAANVVAGFLGAVNQIDAQQTFGSLQKRLARLAAARPFIDTLYAPAPEFLSPKDSTIVCRCEEVTAGEVRQYVALGCTGPNQTKAFGRPGMGPCQGRYCGLTVSEIIARETIRPMQDIGYYRIRPPIKPLMLSELAALASDD